MNQLLQMLPFHKKGYVFILSALLSISLISCGDDDGNGVGPDPEQPTIADQLKNDGELSMLSQFVEQNNIGIDLQGNTSYTLFAPTNAVLEANNFDSLSVEQKTAIVSYHIVPDFLPEDEVRETEMSVSSVQGDSIFISDRTGETKINNRALIQSSQEAQNGAIHKIDKLLLPDTVDDVYEIIDKRYYSHQFACSCTTGRTGLEGTLKNKNNTYTVFVPSDKAFENLEEEIGNLDDVSDDDLREILEYHIVEGQALASGDLSDGQTLTTMNGAEITVSTGTDGGVMLNGNASVEIADIQGTNGVVHIIDKVMEAPEHGEEQM